MILIFLLTYFLYPSISNAYDSSSNVKLQIPRFVSIKSSEANIRTGPNLKYPIKWIFKQKGEPVENIAEFEHWRKIKDIMDEDGWIHESMVKSSRSGIIKGSSYQNSYIKPDSSAKMIMQFEPQVRVKILSCKNKWCQIKASDKKSWIERKNLWGTYEDEDFISK